jgi:hypothetical protein
LVQVLLDQLERIARLYLGQQHHHTVQQLRDGQVAQQRSQEEEEGGQREEKVIGELGGPTKTVIPRRWVLVGLAEWESISVHEVWLLVSQQELAVVGSLSEERASPIP